MAIVRICGPKDKPVGNVNIINCCSISKNWSKGLSPFYIGPCELPSGEISKNVENGWQFCKTFSVHVDKNNNPTAEYFKWRQNGFNDSRAHRYPMGKGIKPLYHFLSNEKLNYIEARKKIYVPLYGKTVVKTEAFKKLLEEFKKLKESEILWLWDFDGYDHKALNMTYKDAINSEERKFGHAFVLGFLLENIK